VIARQVALLFAVGLVVRMGLVLATGHNGVETVESTRIATSLVRTGTFANPYGAGGGPTAHLMPLYPIMLAVPIGVFGLGYAGHLAIALMASAAAAMSFALLPVLARAARLGHAPGLLGGIVGEIAPINFWAQTSGTWEAPVTGLLLVTLTCVIAILWFEQRLTARWAVITGLAAGTGVLLNAAIIPVLAGWFVAGLWGFRRALGAYARVVAIAGGIAVLLWTPWVVRNALAFGAFVPTRTNLGLELQVSNNDAAVADGEKNMLIPAAFTHPASQSAETAKVRSLGEIAYNQAKLAQAKSWIHAHPEAFARLTADRVRLFWFPSMQRWWQTLAQNAITAAGLAGLLLLAIRRQPAALIIGVVFVGYPFIYAFVQVMPRYRYPLEPFLLLLGAVVACRLVARSRP
jgi:hypothetical protein